MQRNSRLADKTIVFSEHEVSKVVRIFLQIKNRLKISLLITKLSISQHIYMLGMLLYVI